MTVSSHETTRRVGGIFGETTGPKGGSIEQRTVVEMQDKDRSVRRNGVDLFQRRHSPFGKLELVPTADHPDPLRWRRPVHLLLQLLQGTVQTGFAIPAEFKIVVEPGSNDVEMGVVQTRYDASTGEVDPSSFGPGRAFKLFGRARSNNPTVLYPQRFDFRMGRI